MKKILQSLKIERNGVLIVFIFIVCVIVTLSALVLLEPMIASFKFISTVSQQDTTSPNFYSDPNRGVAHEVAFFYDGPDKQNYTIDFGDGTPGSMDYQLRQDCFNGGPCPDYFGDHIYSSAGTYNEALKDSSVRYFTS